MDTFRSVSSEDLARWRKDLPKGRRRAIQTRRGVWGESAPVDSVDGNTAYITRPERPGVKREARDVQQALMDRRWAAFQRLQKASPETLQAYAEELRRQYPSLTAHLSTEDVIRTVWKKMNEEATQQAFRMIGRNKVVIP